MKAVGGLRTRTLQSRSIKKRISMPKALVKRGAEKKQVSNFAAFAKNVVDKKSNV